MILTKKLDNYRFGDPVPLYNHIVFTKLCNIRKAYLHY